MEVVASSIALRHARCTVLRIASPAPERAAAYLDSATVGAGANLRLVSIAGPQLRHSRVADLGSGEPVNGPAALALMERPPP